MINGIFIPGITERMFRDCPLEAIEKFRTKGEVIEIEYNPATQWIPVAERLPEEMSDKEAATLIEEINGALKQMRTAESILQLNAIQGFVNRRIFELWTMRCEELRKKKGASDDR